MVFLPRSSSSGRIPVKLLTSICIGVGIPIANVLRVQAKDMRVKRSQRAGELAQKVPVKILFPLIFCILPALFIVVMGPAAISAYHNLFH